ncbi:putative receptor serine-threonine protein kinase [Hibiscus syriacus]|uniref:Receptor serine-threonine protein kinase n=1 Tax=Hibiscus syriacus TaxID=106335 RepID=A0A6A2Y4Y1_HIBSY|nr:putative F-box protein PP2-B12 [Hibiscus syriacus]KAE8671006.1 putative receptor serine-threonine protein kinase [Hibiscus syriacus]
MLCFMKSELSQMGRCASFGLTDLPQDCIAAIISFTSPRDACRLSLVSTTLKSVSESDAVWESFLPSEYRASLPSSICCPSEKQLYLRLSEIPLLIHGGRKSLQLERGSGKKIYMLSARDLSIIWGDTPTYWRWISMPESRFEEVAELMNVCWFEVRGKIAISLLSPMTHYKAYLVFKLTTGAYGLDFQPAEVSFGLVGTEGCKRTVYLDIDRRLRQRYQIVPRRIRLFSRSRLLGFQTSVPTPAASDDDQYPKVRADAWLEIELGEFFNDGCTNGELEMSVLEIKGGHWKGGLIVQGIEFRPNI